MKTAPVKDISFLKEKKDFFKKYGHTDSFLLLECDSVKRYCFIGESVEGYLGFGISLKSAIVLGGIICAPENRIKLVDEFMSYCQSRFKRIIFFNVYEEDAALLKNKGFDLTYVGDDALIDVGAFNVKGTKKRNLRHSASIAKRFCTVSEVKTREDIDKIYPQLLEIEQDFMSEKATKRMNFFTGNLNLGNLEDKRLFVARNADRIEGYVFCHPMYPDDNYRPDLFRKRKNTYGVIELIMLFIIDQLKEEGVPRFTIGLTPAHRSFDESTERYTWYRSFLMTLVTWLNFFMRFIPGASAFNTLHDFKKKFRPDWGKCYVASYPKFNIMVTIANLSIWGFFRIRILFVIKEFWKNLTLFLIKKVKDIYNEYKLKRL